MCKALGSINPQDHKKKNESFKTTQFQREKNCLCPKHGFKSQSVPSKLETSQIIKAKFSLANMAATLGINS
jgi:hypothetical protein